MNTKLSIITINHNNAAGLERTIKSIAQQHYKDYEYIVVDGASTDGSSDVISKYAAAITTRIIEPDHGIYHAMNKGIRSAGGEYLLFINSGDELTEANILGDAMKNVHDTDIISCNLLLVSDKSVAIKEYPENPSFKYLLIDSLPHPATFIKRKLFEITNGYDERLTICADWAFFIIMLCNHNATYRHLPLTLSRFYLDGISSSTDNRALINQERAQVLKEHFARFTDLIEEWNENKKYRFIHENSRLVKIAKKLGFMNPPDSSAF